MPAALNYLSAAVSHYAIQMQEPTLDSVHSEGKGFQRGIHLICHMYEKPPADGYYLFSITSGLQLNYDRNPNCHCCKTHKQLYLAQRDNNSLPNVGFRKYGELAYIFFEVLL
jgi:hypothetical protein